MILSHENHRICRSCRQSARNNTIVNSLTNRKSKKHRHLRQIVTCGILWVWAGVVTLL